jgi:hypothetical protein
MIAVVLAVSLAGTIAITSSIQKVNAIGSQSTGVGAPLKQAAPVATSGDKNVYVAWWSNKTGNDEVMLKASTDGDKTFGELIMLSSNTTSDAS